MKLMANYIIIGGDGKEYGPVTEADIRLWIAEGRLNALSQARSENETTWRSLGAFPEFAGLFATAAASTPLGAVTAEDSALNEGDYELDIGGCVSHGWKIFNSHLGILIGAFLLMLVIQIVVNTTISHIITAAFNSAASQSLPEQIIVSLLQVFLTPLVQAPMTAGLYFLILRVIRGQEATIGSLFAGFTRAFTQLYFASLIINLISFVCFLPLALTVMPKLNPILVKMQNTPDPAQLQQLGNIILPSLPLLIACLILIFILSVSWTFVLPLIIDRQLSVGDAFKRSLKMTSKHWFYVFGLIIVAGAVSLVGALLCCVGVLYTIPLSFTVLMVAYESIFGRKKT